MAFRTLLVSVGTRVISKAWRGTLMFALELAVRVGSAAGMAEQVVRGRRVLRVASMVVRVRCFIVVRLVLLEEVDVEEYWGRVEN